MAGLAVNVDHIATLRQARGTNYPDPMAAAVLAELAGADGIVVHLRQDRRHIQDRDVYLLKKTVASKLILEMAATDEMIKIASDVKPNLVTLVPEKREELTTEGGLDVIGHRQKLEPVIKKFQDNGIVVSLFIDPDPDQIAMAAEIGAEYIEIHTGRYCDAESSAEVNKEFALIDQACITATNFGLKVNAGHGLNYRNVSKIANLPDIVELNIGHAIIGHAIYVGIERAVREMKSLLP